jgi:uncharacterized coiled-coil protein SlyX
MFNKSFIWLLPILIFFSCTDTEDLENRIKELEDRITELEYRLTTLNTTLESILTDIDEITAQLDELENEVSGDDGLIETIESLRAMLEDLKQRLTMITGIVNEDHYFDPSSGWMMFNDAIISGDSSHAEVYFSQEGDFAWELYSQFYLQDDESDDIPAGWYYTSRVGDGFVLFKDLYNGAKLNWYYKVLLSKSSP